MNPHESTESLTAAEGGPDEGPAAAYARMRRRQGHPLTHEFAEQRPFALDDFQIRACHQLEKGRSVLVAAPTGSGKTIVGEFAIHMALSQGRKAFYTTPIKALSNQKFADLVDRYGADNVGLLTGDNTINGEAPVVVMTTEVLRNMLYSGSRTLDRLAFVVMDEVHYLADRSRGAVWEEVIIHLPESVALVALSATVSNAEEFGDWLATVRGETATVLEERRPVPLYQHVMVGRRLYDLFAGEEAYDPARSDEVPEVNPELLRVARDDWAASRLRDRRSSRGGKPQGRRNVGNGRRVWIPSKPEIVERLDRSGLLPAIVFVFSRVGCDKAVESCLAAQLRLTTPEERDEILAFTEAACAHLPEEDLHVLGYHDFLDALTRGIAAHHAGMLPTFKEVVEDLFQRGLVKVVFATETLALGINMPARSVVVEKLSKWNGETHADLTPGEYTQLTGRAGRRGIDVEGHGVVLWQPGTEPKAVAGLASTRTYPLRSSFRPSYNMAVNLVRRFGRQQARELLEQSFAQFQADRAVVGLARKLRKSEDALEGYAEAAACDRGDFMEYAGLRRRISDLEQQSKKSRRFDARRDAEESLENLRPGDVIRVPSGKYAGYAVIVDPGVRSDRDGPRPFVVTLDRHARRLSMVDFPTPVKALTRVKVPRNFNGRDPQSRRDLANTLRLRTRDLPPEPPAKKRRGPAEEDGEIGILRDQMRSHPCHSCPDREDHARWAERWHRLDRDAQTLRRRIESRTNTIAREFDRICEVLDALGYLAGDEVTERGERLMRIYAELDLVVAEALQREVYADLTAPELAAALSTVVYESRRLDDSGPPRIPPGASKQALESTRRIWLELEALQRDHRIAFTRETDRGFAWAAYRWASGDDLDDVLADTGLAAGDFVRWIKQLVDLTGQLADAAGDTPLRRTARTLVPMLRRGVVAYSSVSD